MFQIWVRIAGAISFVIGSPLFWSVLRRLNPQRYREKVPILLAAGINSKCPIDIVKLLSIKGASWEEYVIVNGYKRTIKVIINRIAGL